MCVYTYICMYVYIYIYTHYNDHVAATDAEMPSVGSAALVRNIYIYIYICIYI